MALFASPEEHAANSPDTWRVRRSGSKWALVDGGDDALDIADTQAGAELLRTEGFIADLYAKETRWYAGESVPGYPDYSDAVAKEIAEQFSTVRGARRDTGDDDMEKQVSARVTSAHKEWVTNTRADAELVITVITEGDEQHFTGRLVLDKEATRTRSTRGLVLPDLDKWITGGHCARHATLGIGVGRGLMPSILSFPCEDSAEYTLYMERHWMEEEDIAWPLCRGHAVGVMASPAGVLVKKVVRVEPVTPESESLVGIDLPA